MATINSSFKRRMDDMFSVSTPRTQKRKFSNTTFSTPSQSNLHGHESHILIPFEKRKKIAQWEEFPPRNGTRAELFPSSVQPVFRNYNHTNGNVLGAFSPRPQGSPQALPSTVTPILNGIISGPVSPHVVVNPGRAYKGSLLSRRDSGPLSLALSRTVRESTVNGHIIPHVDEDLEKEALRRQNKKSMELNRDLMEALERARARELKDAVELQQFKELFRTIKNADVAQESQNMSGQREGLGFLPREEFGAISRRSFFGDILVSGGSESRSGSLLDEGIAASGGSGGERLQDPEWKELWNKVKEPSRTEKEASLEKEIEYTQSKLLALQLERTSKLKAEKKPEDKTLVDAFTPLSAEADEAVDEALGGGERYEILVTHEKSNIDVTRGIMLCLSPGVWLNDEVINVYMELLKERELREPDRFLKCHFFNTFFYNKLFKDKRSYDYKAIRRWTTQKKLGYSLSDCDKILVPIHQEIHWCLAVINIRDKRLEYLDSLKGGDRLVLDNLARYIADEAKDKDGKVLDASTWDQDFPKDIPEQLNGCDCGMFMVKYADFHSRGAPLQFSQEHMEYFRRKMVWEILDLQAT